MSEKSLSAKEFWQSGELKRALSIVLIMFGLVFCLNTYLDLPKIHEESLYPEQYETVEARVTGIYYYYEDGSARSPGSHIKHWVTTVSYVYDGWAYENVALHTHKKGMLTGDMIDIYIDPADPGSPKYQTYDHAEKILLAVLSSSVLLCGMVLFILSFFDLKKRLIDKGEGERVSAILEKIEPNRKQDEFRYTYRLIAKWEDENGIWHRFISESLNIDPSVYINVGDLIEVYVDPKNYRKYHVCAKELEQEYEKSQTNKGKWD